MHKWLKTSGTHKLSFTMLLCYHACTQLKKIILIQHFFIFHHAMGMLSYVIYIDDQVHMYSLYQCILLTNRASWKDKCTCIVYSVFGIDISGIKILTYVKPIHWNRNVILMNFCHWLHWKLSFWQLSVWPVTRILVKWWHFHYSVCNT